MNTPRMPRDSLQPDTAKALEDAEKALHKAERKLRLMRKSRREFIVSLRYTGLSYAEAKSKYDVCIEQQLALQHYLQQAFNMAYRRHHHDEPRDVMPDMV